MRQIPRRIDDTHETPIRKAYAAGAPLPRSVADAFFEKFGVRIEDIFYVDPSGKLVDLTASLPRTTGEIEQAMRAH